MEEVMRKVLGEKFPYQVETFADEDTDAGVEET